MGAVLARSVVTMRGIALEKRQSAQLAEKIDKDLDQLMAIACNPFHVPARIPIELVDNDAPAR